MILPPATRHSAGAPYLICETVFLQGQNLIQLGSDSAKCCSLTETYIFFHHTRMRASLQLLGLHIDSH